jgi:hypothetical protein
MPALRVWPPGLRRSVEGRAVCPELAEGSSPVPIPAIFKKAPLSSPSPLMRFGELKPRRASFIPTQISPPLSSPKAIAESQLQRAPRDPILNLIFCISFGLLWPLDAIREILYLRTASAPRGLSLRSRGILREAAIGILDSNFACPRPFSNSYKITNNLAVSGAEPPLDGRTPVAPPVERGTVGRRWTNGSSTPSASPVHRSPLAVIAVKAGSRATALNGVWSELGHDVEVRNKTNRTI